MKKCSRCEKTKPLDSFNKNKAQKDGLQNQCRPCHKQYKDEWNKANKKKCQKHSAKWRQANKEHVREYDAKYYQTNKEQILEQMAEYRTRIPPSIYQVLNKQTGCRYIGESESPIRRRIEHWSRLRGGYHDNPNLQQAYDKYGEDAFEFEILEHCEPSQLKQREAYWIKKHSDNCYNVVGVEK